MALEASGHDSMNVVHRPRLLSDDGSSYIAGDLADWLEEKGWIMSMGLQNASETPPASRYILAQLRTEELLKWLAGCADHDDGRILLT